MTELLDLELKNRVLAALPVDGPPIRGAADGYVRLTFGDAASSLVVFGGTGAGKTESVMRPILWKLLHHRAAGLVLDVKSDYVGLCLAEFPDQVLVIGTRPEATPVNLLAGITLERFRQTMLAVSQPACTTTTSGSYFALMGVEAMSLVFATIKYGLEQEPTFAGILDLLASPREFCKLLLSLKGSNGFAPELAGIVRQQEQDWFGLLGVGGYIEGNPDKYIPESRQLEQLSWALNYLRASLGPLASDRALRAAFSGHAAIDFDRLVYGQGKTLVLDLPAGEYGSVAGLVSKFLRLRFTDAVRRRGVAALRQAGYGASRFTFLFADEYQAHIAGASEASAYDDAEWFSVSRAFGHMNIVATQGLGILLTRADRPSVESIVQNCRTKIILGCEDPETVALAENLSRGSERLVRSKLLYSEGPGSGYAFVKASGYEGGRTIAACFDCRRPTRYPFMKRFIGRELEPAPAVQTRRQEPAARIGQPTGRGDRRSLR